MLLNLIFMLVNRHIFKYLALILPILATILGVVQVALGLQIIYKALTELLKT
jgi:small neutral amino acid transporter SnatA (MarC family)